MPRWSASSIKLTASKTGNPASSNCRVKFNIRPKCLASTTWMTTSRSVVINRSRPTFSSSVIGNREYIPGVSKMAIACSPTVIFPVEISTVVPG